MHGILRFAAMALVLAGLGGCVVAPGYGYGPGYGYAPGYAYAPAPYYYGPPIAIGIGGGWGGWGGGWGHWR